jgi:hypothetical protein
VKRLCPFLVLVLALTAALLMPSQMAHAQVPNAGFENWTTGNPDGWTTNNFPPLLVFIQQTNVAHSGASAAQASTVDFGGSVVPPVLISGTGGAGFPINFRPGSLHWFYTFTPVGGDFIAVSVVLTKNGQPVGGGGGQLNLAATSTYVESFFDIFYVAPDVPDTANVTFLISASGGVVHAGSTFTIDDLSWGAPATGVNYLEANRPVQFGLEQNYPNPFNPTTNVRFSVPENGFVTLKVFDLMGREVSTLIEQQLSAGSYETTFAAGSLASGMYLYRLTAGGKVETRRMILMK